MKKTIVIIGAGTYGSYLTKCLAEKYADAEIHLFDVGDETIRSESEIGYLSRIRSGVYKAASDGRFFGLGGTSAKWGGQLLFFSDIDLADDSGMREMIDCNIQYREKVLKRFFSKVPALVEQDLGNGLFLKQGVWLKFGQRNIFDHFRIASLSNVRIHRNKRAIRLNVEDGKISSVTFLNKSGKTADVESDIYYLTGGAFESLRLLHVSGIVDAEASSRGFSDHVTLRCFEFKGSNTKAGPVDFGFRFVDGSMVTTRIVGDVENVGFYVHPIFNEEFNFFQFLKQLVFKGKFSAMGAFYAVKQILPTFAFAWSYLWKRKLYVYGKWFLHINVELSGSENQVVIAGETDRFGQNALEIKYDISGDTAAKVLAIKQKVKKLLIEAKADFEEIDDGEITAASLEDVYHPYALFSYDKGQTIFDAYHPASNLYMFNTGLLRRSGGINPTASLFCLIEQHIAAS